MHQKNPSHATFIASNCTSLSNHIYIIVSFILFGFMAFSMHSGKSISTITALSPAPSTTKKTPDSRHFFGWHMAHGLVAVYSRILDSQRDGHQAAFFLVAHATPVQKVHQ